METRSELERILTPSQRNQFKATLEEGGGLGDAINSMNLSSDQMKQLRAVFQSSRAAAEGIITPDQRRQILQNIRSQWGGGLGGPGMRWSQFR